MLLLQVTHKSLASYPCHLYTMMSEWLTPPNPPAVTVPADDDLPPLYNSTYLLDIVPKPPHTCLDQFGISFMCNFTDQLPPPSYEEDPDNANVFYCYNTVVKVPSAKYMHRF